MKNKVYLRVILFLLFFLVDKKLVFPQTDSVSGKKYISSNILFAFNGSIIYPGLKIGIEIPAYSVYIVKKENRTKAKSFSKDRYFSVISSWYH